MNIFANINLLRRTAKQVWREFNQAGCFSQAASLSFVTLFALVPLLTVSFSVLGAFPVFKSLSIRLQQIMFEDFFAVPAESVRDYLQSFVGQTAQLSEIGMIFLMVTAVLLVFSMELTFNAIWHVKRNRKGTIAFLLYWAVITLIPILIATVVWLAGYLIQQLNLISPHLFFIESSITFGAPYFAIFFAFMLLYVTLPNCKVRMRDAAIAALIATILFELARKGFAIYILNFAVYKIIYGGLAAVPIFLIWLYVSWVLILFGVVINYVLALRNENN
jgi:membrane protein